MISGSSAAENLLLVIETQRKGEGVITGLRRELAGLGATADQASGAIASGAEAGIAEILKLSRTIDVANKAEVESFKETSQAVREMAQSIALAPGEVKKLAVAEEVLAARMKAATAEARVQAATILGTTGTAYDKLSRSVYLAAYAMDEELSKTPARVSVYEKLTRAIYQQAYAMDAEFNKAKAGSSIYDNLNRSIYQHAYAMDAQFNKAKAGSPIYDNLSRSIYAAAYAMDAKATSATQMTPKVRTAANAVNTLALSAAGFTSGGTAAVMAAGNFASSIASLSSSARVAASATGIGAIAVVLGTIISLMRTAKAEAADLSSTMDVIKSVGSAAEAVAVSREIDRQLEDARRKLKDFDAEVASRPRPAIAGDVVGSVIGVLDARKAREERGKIEAEIEGLQKASAAAFKSYADILGREGERAGKEFTAKAKSEADRLAREQRESLKRNAEAVLETRKRLAFAVLDLEEARDNDVYTQRRLKLERAYSEEVVKLKELEISDRTRLELQQQAYQVRQKGLEALAEEQRLMRSAYERENRMTAAARPGGVNESYDVRVSQIQAEAELDLKAGQRREDVERRTQLKIRQLQRDTLLGTVRDLKTIEDATINSKSRQIRAVGQAAMVLRRLEIGAEAARASVESARAFAKVPGALAAGNPASAALWAASGVQLAAAAALGFREALGGGGGAGGGGSAGTPAPERGTFEPRQASNGPGALNLTLITRNPYGRDSIQNVAYELNRSQILNRPPIEIPATNGITRVA